jgi:hypothetical protein
MPQYAPVAGKTTDTFTPDNLIVGEDLDTVEVLLTGAVAYARGDLLILNATTNVVTLAAAGTIANVTHVMPFTLSAADATAQVATGKQVAVYSEGEFAQDLVTLAGVALTAPQIVAAKAALNTKQITLRKVL